MGKKIIPDASPEQLKVGDIVSFRGHILTVLSIKDNGYIEAWSPLFHVTTDEPGRFTKVAEDGK